MGCDPAKSWYESALCEYMSAGNTLEKCNEICQQIPIKGFTILKTHNDFLIVGCLNIIIEYLEIIIKQFWTLPSC